MRFTSGNQVAFEFGSGPSEHLELPLEPLRIAIVAHEVSAALLALDHDGPWSGRSAANGPTGGSSEERCIHTAPPTFKPAGIEQTAVGVVEPARGIDAVLGDRAADLGRDRSASEAGEPGDGETF
jgi:hypothetical protein